MFPIYLFISVSSTNVWHETVIILLPTTCCYLPHIATYHMLLHTSYVPLFVHRILSKKWKLRGFWYAVFCTHHSRVFAWVQVFSCLSVHWEWINTVVSLRLCHDWPNKTVWCSGNTSDSHMTVRGLMSARTRVMLTEIIPSFFSDSVFQIPCNSSFVAVLEERQSE
jgi:hypothetical protein